MKERDIYKRIKAIANERGFKLAWVAEQMHTSTQNMAKSAGGWPTGKLERLCHVLKCQWTDLTGSDVRKFDRLYDKVENLNEKL